MLVLAVDTAFTQSSVALAESGHVLARAALDPERTNSATLLPAMEQVLGEAGRSLAELGGLAVTKGPGYFTGLRIGLSTVLGLAMGLGLKVAAISSLRLLAAGAPDFEGSLWATADARRGLLYGAAYGPGRPEPPRLCDEMAITPAKLAKLIKPPALLVGDGARLYSDELCGPGVALAEAAYDQTDAGLLATVGEARLEAGGGQDPAEVAPAYLRPSDAEVRFGLPLDEYNLVE